MSLTENQGNKERRQEDCIQTERLQRHSTPALYTQSYVSDHDSREKMFSLETRKVKTRMKEVKVGLMPSFDFFSLHKRLLEEDSLSPSLCVETKFPSRVVFVFIFLLLHLLASGMRIIEIEKEDRETKEDKEKSMT